MYAKIAANKLPGDLPVAMLQPGDYEDLLVNDALGSIHAADSSGLDEELETGDAKAWNFPTRED